MVCRMKCYRQEMKGYGQEMKKTNERKKKKSAEMRRMFTKDISGITHKNHIQESRTRIT